MKMELSDQVKLLIDGPNFGHLATTMSDGSPQVAPVWIDREGDLLLVGTGNSTLKAKNTRRDARIALSIIDQQDPYHEAQIRGEVVEHRSDESLETMDAIAHKYTGKPFPWRVGEGRVVLVIRVNKVRYGELPFKHTPP
jgi:PPOX class probable F420-dependent enzyme